MPTQAGALLRPTVRLTPAARLCREESRCRFCAQPLPSWQAAYDVEPSDAGGCISMGIRVNAQIVIVKVRRRLRLSMETPSRKQHMHKSAGLTPGVVKVQLAAAA